MTETNSKNTPSSSLTSKSILADNIYAVILAGGSGTRFWPKSRRKTPKQLCKIGNSQKTMIEITLERLDGFVEPRNRLIITHADQIRLTREIVGAQCGHIIAEPEARQTTAALTLAALAIDELQAKRGDERPAVMISLHADHMIGKLAEFKSVLRRAVEVASNDLICLLGVTASRPDTGFGYIEKSSNLVDSGQGSLQSPRESSQQEPRAGSETNSETNSEKSTEKNSETDLLLAPHAFMVKSFREKPDLATAKEFIATGNFYWNAGLFVWKTDKLLDEISKFMPVTLEALKDAQRTHTSLLNIHPEKLQHFYSRVPKVAIDHAVLELSHDVAVVEADIAWQDVGTWAALDEAFGSGSDTNGNLIFTDAEAIDCRNMIIDGDGPFVAALGLDDLVIVAMKDAVLVAPKDRSQDVKLFVDKLKGIKREDLY